MKKRTSVKADKAIQDWVLAIYCDYGKPGTKRLIRASYSIESGLRSWNKFSKFGAGRYHCWQEDKSGKTIRSNRES
jgi:hypothetical protein